MQHFSPRWVLRHPCRLRAEGELVPCPGLANAPILLHLGSCSPVLHSYLVVSSKSITSAARRDCPGCGPHFAGAHIGVAASVSAGTPDAPHVPQGESGWEARKNTGHKGKFQLCEEWFIVFPSHNPSKWGFQALGLFSLESEQL